ncbi:hypothetical protein [Streptomyces sp. NPDC049881]|uniref:hypothetical protein n=1 Tax=unclassified Streptomyces TaxID=2593676 RepID=UPI003446DB57
MTRLSPTQQMGISCARCGRRLGASGRRAGRVRDRWGHAFVLWVCSHGCFLGGRTR